MTREEAIEILWRYDVNFEPHPPEEVMHAIDMAIEALKEVQKHEETFEWCHDCKEYDKENYCCHRWSKVIRNTVEELKEEPPTIPCFTGSAEAYKAWTGEEMGGTSDLICRSDALEQMAQAECGLHYDDCEPDNCSCSYIQRILDIPSADAVSRGECDECKTDKEGVLLQQLAELQGDYETMKNAYEDALADAVEVVRCGECQYMRTDGKCVAFADDVIRPSVSDFCSYGKRKGGDSE